MTAQMQQMFGKMTREQVPAAGLELRNVAPERTVERIRCRLKVTIVAAIPAETDSAPERARKRPCPRQRGYDGNGMPVSRRVGVRLVHRGLTGDEAEQVSDRLRFHEPLVVEFDIKRLLDRDLKLEDIETVADEADEFGIKTERTIRALDLAYRGKKLRLRISSHGYRLQGSAGG